MKLLTPLLIISLLALLQGCLQTNKELNNFKTDMKDNEMNGQGILWVEGREIRGIWADNKYLYESAESVDK